MQMHRAPLWRIIQVMYRLVVLLFVSLIVHGALGQSVVTEEVVFSRSSGLIAGPVTLDAEPAALAGANVRYTLDNSEPLAGSPVWNGTLSINSTSIVRARVVAADGGLGPIKSRHFVLVDTTLSNYRGSKKPFSSTLPLVVIATFGNDIDNDRNSQFSYVATVMPDPVTKRASLLGPLDYQGRGGIGLRGESSAGFDQRSYSWETQDDLGADKPVSVLGLPEESDWVLYAPYTDKSMMRNEFTFSRMRALRGDGSAMRAVYCEVFVNTQPGEALSMNDYRGVYVLLERIKRDSERINLASLGNADTSSVLVTGGYIFRKDKPSLTNYSFDTAVAGIPLQVVEPSAPNNQQTTYLEEHLEEFENALFGNDFADPEDGYAKYIDPLTFIDNQLFVEITKQIDGYRLSTYFTKDRGRRIKALPLWDYNLSLGNADYLTGEFPEGWYYQQLGGTDYPWYPRLHEDPAFTLAFWDRYWELRRGVFSNSAVLKEVSTRRTRLLGGRTESVTNNTSQSIQTPAARHFRRWPILGTYIWPNERPFSLKSAPCRVSSPNDWAGWINNMRRAMSFLDRLRSRCHRVESYRVVSW